MSLAPLNGVSPESGQDQQGASQGESFRQQKMRELEQERNLQGTREPQGTPDPYAESAEDGYPDAPEGYDLQDDASAEYVESEESEQLEADDDVDQAEGSELEQLREEKLRLEQTITRITDNRKKIESDYSDSIADNTRLRFELEDTLQASREQGQFWVNLANQRAQYFEQLDWSQVPPEKAGELRQQAQQAQMQRNQIYQHFQAIAEKQKQAFEQVKQREAEVARQYLARTIPEWGNEKYREIGEYAQQWGFNAQDYGEITDPRTIRMLHALKEQADAVKKVGEVKNNPKARAPRGKSAREQPRNAQGRFKKSQQQAFASRDKRDIRQMFQDKLAAERSRGR